MLSRIRQSGYPHTHRKRVRHWLFLRSCHLVASCLLGGSGSLLALQPFRKLRVISQTSPHTQAILPATSDIVSRWCAVIVHNANALTCPPAFGKPALGNPIRTAHGRKGCPQKGTTSGRAAALAPHNSRKSSIRRRVQAMAGGPMVCPTRCTEIEVR